MRDASEGSSRATNVAGHGGASRCSLIIHPARRVFHSPSLPSARQSTSIAAECCSLTQIRRVAVGSQRLPLSGTSLTHASGTVTGIAHGAIIRMRLLCLRSAIWQPGGRQRRRARHECGGR